MGIMVRDQNNLFLMVQKMLDDGIKSVAIIQSPDYSGGHDQSIYSSSDKDEDWYEGLQPFTYVEWEGNPIDLLKNEPWLDMHKEPFHSEPYDSKWPWYLDIGLKSYASVLGY